MLKISLLSFVLLFPVLVLGNNQKSFIISKTNDKKISKMSKNVLKEHLGESMRDAFHVTTELGKEMGMLQIELASYDVKPGLKANEGVAALSNQIHKHVGQFQIELALVQKRFSHIIERLVDDQPPFKKAGRDALRGAYTFMIEVEQDLKKQVSTCSKFAKQLSKNEAADKFVLMQKTGQSLQAHVDALKKIQVNMNVHECLKNV